MPVPAVGARLAVLVDPEERAVEVYRPSAAAELHRDPVFIALDPELPGFLLEQQPVFS